MPVYGKVTAVSEEPTGTTLGLPGNAGATFLVLDDLSALSWPTGTLSVDGAIYEYTVDGLSDPDTDELEDNEDTTDLEAGTVSLATPLAESHAIDAVVSQYPDTVEKTATVIVPGQQEELHLRVPQHLTDRLPTGIRTAPDDTGAGADAETVELEFRDDDWVIVDQVDQTGTGRDRAYNERVGTFPITSTDPYNPTVIVSANIDIPTAAHRIQVWYSLHLTSNNGDISVGFDDGGFDFAPGSAFHIADFDNSESTADPVLVTPLIPTLGLTPEGVSTGTAIVDTNGVPEVTAVLNAAPTTIMPYVNNPPTPGTHTFRITAFATVGSGTPDCGAINPKLWITVI